MTAEEYNQLLDNDLTRYLCSALPYGVNVSTPDGNGKLLGVVFDAIGGPICTVSGKTKRYHIGDVKPILRKVEDLTSEECDEIFALLNIDADGGEDYIKINDATGIEFFFPTGRWQEDVVKFYDWSYKHRLDTRYLIERNLALRETKHTKQNEEI